jgi:low temperature requirement protein LtrA
MSIKDKLPYSYNPQVRQRIEELFSRELLGAVLVGKFVGDYAAIKTTQVFGTDLGYLIGITVTISLFIYWEKVAQKAKQKKDEMSKAQTQIGDFK